MRGGQVGWQDALWALHASELQAEPLPHTARHNSFQYNPPAAVGRQEVLVHGGLEAFLDLQAVVCGTGISRRQVAGEHCTIAALGLQ